MAYSPVLRCKMWVARVSQEMGREGGIESERVELTAVYASKGPNAEWSKATPAAQFQITISNPAAFGQLSKGHEFYVDFTPAEDAGEAKA